MINFASKQVYAQSIDMHVPISGGGIPVTPERLTGLIQQVAQFLINVAPLFAVIFIIWGGITYMAAGADEEKAKQAKTRIKNAIIGSFVIFGVGIILQTIFGVVQRVSL
jgi:TRAP-type C4-dicarboxylate transport system permease small subunit